MSGSSEVAAPACSSSPLILKDVLASSLTWLCVFIVGLTLLAGRYDWSLETAPYAWKGYLSSAYMLVATLPALYYLLVLFEWNRRWRLAATAALTLLLTLPYRWLGLNSLYYNRNRPAFWPGAAMPKLPWGSNWFPQCLNHLRSSPREGLLFGSLVLAGFLIAWIYWHSNGKTRCEASGGRGRTTLFWLGLYLFILFETWLHLGARSPYLYICTYEQPAQTNYLYAVYLSPDGLNPVNGDYFIFRELEEYFEGRPQAMNGMQIRRSYEAYLSSQISYFFNPYYVYLGINVALWFLACLCAYRYACPDWGRRTAIFFAFLAGCGPGFIMYAGQPMFYVTGYALNMMLLWLYERMILTAPPRALGRFALYGLVLGIGSMVYDLFPMYLVLILYAWHRRSSVACLLASIALSLTVYFGFLELQQHWLKLAVSDANSKYLTIALQNFIALIAAGDVATLYERLAGMLGNFITNLSYAFFFFPLMLALLGLVFNSGAEKTKRALVPLMGALALNCYLWMGGDYLLARMPRFMFIAYPCVYLLAASFVDRASTEIHRRWPVLPAGGLAALMLAPALILSNIDIFGYPQMYYWFYYVRGGFW